MARRGPSTTRRKCNVGLQRSRRRRRRRSEEEEEEDANRAQARTANGDRVTVKIGRVREKEGES